MKILLRLSLLLPLTVFAGADSIVYTSVHQIQAGRVIKVGDRENTAQTLAASAKRMGGWMLRQEPERIALRVPADSVDAFLTIADTLGLTVVRSYVREDNTAEYVGLLAKAQAKRFLLQRYMEVLDSSGTGGVYPVSRSIADLGRSIEETMGRIRGLEERARYAEIDIHFSFQDRRPPRSGGWSDFGWINSVDLPSLLEDFQR